MHCVSSCLIFLSCMWLTYGLPAGSKVMPSSEVADLKKQLDHLHTLLTELSEKLDAADGKSGVTTATTPPPSHGDLDLIGHMISRLHHLEKKAKSTTKALTHAQQGAEKNTDIDSSNMPPELIKKLSKDDLLRLQKALKWQTTKDKDNVQGSSVNSLSHRKGNVKKSAEQSAHAVPQLSLDDMRRLAQEQYEGHFGEFGVKRRLGQLSGTWKDGPVDDKQLGAVPSEVDTTENPKAVLAKLINTLQAKTEKEVEDEDSQELSTLSQTQ